MLSVIIPARDAARWIAQAVVSARAQPEADEVIVITDRCSDDTAAIAATAGARVIDSPGRGPSAARNAGVAASSADFIAFLDADDLWPAGSLGPRLALLRSTPDAALAFGDCRQFDNAPDGGPHACTLFEQGSRDAAFFGGPHIVTEALRKLLDADFVTTGSVVMRRSAFDALGGFDCTLGMVEDLDLWLRTAARYPILWHPGLALLRRRHDSNLSRDARAMQCAHIEVLQRLARAQKPGAARSDIDRHRRKAQRALARQDFPARPVQALRMLLRSLQP